ncbi:hypothetical protein [Hymenobacter sp.]|jgi:hypothetical protein|uniref:hypothetical protein n=1 Tax=Hymenobacter sp. TaxID=1898978 RepID=UPI002ED868A0
MKPITLLAFGFCCASLVGFNLKPPTPNCLGTWKVQLVYTENYCDGSTGIKEKATGGLENQVWIVSQEKDSYVLDTGQRLGLLKGGQFIGKELHFNKIVGDKDPAGARQIVFTVDKKGKLTGKCNLAPTTTDGICIKRYTLIGQR